MNLAPNVYVAQIDQRSVILDLNHDRYIGLNPYLTKVLQSLSSPLYEGRQIPYDDKGAVAKLLNKGLLIDQGQPKTSPHLQAANASQVIVPQATSSLWALLSDERASDAPVSGALMMSAIVALTQVATSLRVQSFKSTIDWLKKTKIAERGRRAHSSTETLGSTQALIDAFDEVRPYFPLKPICRLDAPSLCLHLHRNGKDAQLVFGVRLDPFAAHCWVQIGEVAIGEPWASVRQYTPILVI